MKNRNWTTIGHDQILEILGKAVELDRMSHSFVITGIESVGKMTVALDIAKAANCEISNTEQRPCGECSQCQRIQSGYHTDVFIYDLEIKDGTSGQLSTTITMEQLREDFLKQIHRKPFEGKTRVFIIASADLMRLEQSNILLKTLEEPPDDTIIILLATGTENLLETIVSRCQLLQLKPASTEKIMEVISDSDFHTEIERNKIARLARGRIGWAIRASGDSTIVMDLEKYLDSVESAVTGSLEDRFEFSRVLAMRFREDTRIGMYDMDLMLTWWRDLLMLSIDSDMEIVNISRRTTMEDILRSLTTAEIVKAISQVRIALDNIQKNLNPRLVCDNMMLKFPVTTISSS